MKNWWKYLTVILLFYTIVSSLYRPLAPGISAVSRDILKPGLNTGIDVEGYNTHFPAKDKISVWVKSGETEWCVPVVMVSSNESLSFDLDVPEQLPSHALSLYIQYEGASLFLENAFHVNDVASGVPDSHNDCKEVNKPGT